MKPFETIASDWALLPVSESSARPLDIKTEFNAGAKPSLAAEGYSTRTPYRMTENAILSDDQATITFCSTIVMRRTGFQGDQSSSRIPTNNLQGRRIAIAVSSESIWHENRPSIEVHECRALGRAVLNKVIPNAKFPSCHLVGDNPLSSYCFYPLLVTFLPHCATL